MSSGYYRLARVETNDGTICIDEGWGAYSDVTVNVGATEIALTREQYTELLRQMNAPYELTRTEALTTADTATLTTADGLPF